MVITCYRRWLVGGNIRTDKQTLEKIAIICGSCGKEKMIDVDFLDNSYQEIITTFVFNTMLHHVGMLWIIEKLSIAI